MRSTSPKSQDNGVERKARDRSDSRSLSPRPRSPRYRSRSPRYRSRSPRYRSRSRSRSFERRSRSRSLPRRDRRSRSRSRSPRYSRQRRNPSPPPRGRPREQRQPGDEGRREFRRGPRRNEPFDPPEIFSIHQGVVRRVADFGAFVEMEGLPGKWGLVHFSQIANKPAGEKVVVDEEVKVGDKVRVKVLSVDVENQKISLSMKFVDQETGEDLDPSLVAMEKEKQNEQRRKTARMPRDDSEYRNHEWGRKSDKKEAKEEEEEPEEGQKETANYGLSGLLASETRTWKGVELKFVEPMEARMPDKKWRLYEFKGEEQLRILHLHRCSCYIFGRDRSLGHFPGFVATDHPSCSKQHAVIQFRQHEKDDGIGGVILSVRPYLMDLKTTNGTTLNGERIEDMRYYELKERDNIKFGNSSRDYVLLHEGSA